MKGYEALEAYGWYFESEEEKEVLDGSHMLYEKKQEDNERENKRIWGNENEQENKRI